MINQSFKIQEHQDETIDAMAEANTSIWKDDSGATDHCCNEKELFRDISTCEINLATAGEHIITAEGIGNIDFYDESGNTCTLSEVLYIPKLNQEQVIFEKMKLKYIQNMHLQKLDRPFSMKKYKDQLWCQQIQIPR